MPQALNEQEFWLNLLNMLLYSYNNIIIIATVILLEFLSPQFVHPGTL